ncbi:MAG TPA: hypothetical protein VFI29_17570 [Hanamia sp.]|nr:hypothetical protein [Hanamia sp.]
MDKNFIPISVAFVFAILISFWIKGVLDNNNVKVNPFTGFFRDTRNIFKLSSAATNNVTRKYFYLLGILNILSRVALLILFIVFVALTIKEDNAAVCNSYKDLKNDTYDYLVINKYIDSNEHSYRTLILQNKGGYHFKYTDLDFDKSNLFNFLSVGDSIKKEKGSAIVSVINRKVDTTFKVDYGCDEK